MPSADWIETKEIINEVELLFNHNNNIQEINDINKMKNEIKLIYDNKIKLSAENIQKMNGLLQAKEKETSVLSDAEHNLLIKRLINEKDAIQSEINNIREQIDNKRDNIFKISKMELEIKDKISECQSAIQLHDSRISYAISLYSKISKINWDYSNSHDNLCGDIANDLKSEVVKFNIDTNQFSKYEVTNKLWDLIGETFE